MAKRKQYIEAAGPRVPQLSAAMRCEIFGTGVRFGDYWFRISERDAKRKVGRVPEDYYDPDILFKDIRDGMRINVVYQETGKYIGCIDNERIEIGEQLMCSDPDGLEAYACFLRGAWDGRDADMWLQFVTLGSVKFS